MVYGHAAAGRGRRVPFRPFILRTPQRGLLTVQKKPPPALTMYDRLKYPGDRRGQKGDRDVQQRKGGRTSGVGITAPDGGCIALSFSLYAIGPRERLIDSAHLIIHLVKGEPTMSYISSVKFAHFLQPFLQSAPLEPCPGEAFARQKA